MLEEAYDVAAEHRGMCQTSSWTTVTRSLTGRTFAT